MPTKTTFDEYKTALENTGHESPDDTILVLKTSFGFVEISQDQYSKGGHLISEFNTTSESFGLSVEHEGTLDECLRFVKLNY